MALLVNDYVDPSVFLQFHHTETIALHSHFTKDTDISSSDDLSIIQTLIFSANKCNGGDVLDTAKTVVEYYCPNPQLFTETSGSIILELYDITRDVIISSQTIDLEEIATNWNTLAASGSTSPNTMYKSFSFTGLMNKTPSYDCIWQFRGVASHASFTFRINGLQYIYYDIL